MMQPHESLESVAHLIAGMRDRNDRVASALWLWLEHHAQPIESLAEMLDCNTQMLERLALVPRPLAGRDWEDDVEIIAISLHICHAALRTILYEADNVTEREVGA